MGGAGRNDGHSNFDEQVQHQLLINIVCIISTASSKQQLVYHNETNLLLLEGFANWKYHIIK